MEKTKQKKCPSCGASVDENVKFCQHCGTKLVEDAPQNKEPVQQVNAQTQNGQPFVYFNVPPQNQNTGANTVAAQSKKKTGAFVASLVCFFIGLLFVGFYAMFFGQMIAAINSGDGWAFLAFFFYLVTIGWISIIPAVALNIASLACSIACLKSSSKTQKVFGIIILIFSIIILVGILASIVLAQLGVYHV